MLGERRVFSQREESSVHHLPTYFLEGARPEMSHCNHRTLIEDVSSESNVRPLEQPGLLRHHTDVTALTSKLAATRNKRGVQISLALRVVAIHERLQLSSEVLTPGVRRIRDNHIVSVAERPYYADPFGCVLPK